LFFGKPVQRSGDVGKATNKASVVGAKAQKAFNILCCSLVRPSTYCFNLLGVGRYAMVAHHIAKERYRSLEENALLRA